MVAVAANKESLQPWLGNSFTAAPGKKDFRHVGMLLKDFLVCIQDLFLHEGH